MNAQSVMRVFQSALASVMSLLRPRLRAIPLWLFLALIVNGIILLAYMAFALHSEHSQSQYLEREIQKDLSNIAQGIATAVANDILIGSLDSLEDRLKRSVTLSSVTEIVVTDSFGRIISKVQRDLNDRPVVLYQSIGLAIAVEGVSEESPITAPDSHPTKNAFVSLIPIDRGERIGWVRVTSSDHELKELRRTIRQDTFAASLITSLTLLIVLSLAIRRITRRIEIATQFANSLTLMQGQRLDADSATREINQLERALTAASQTLKRQFHKLQDSNSRKGAILEASLDSLITIDAYGLIVDFNPSAEVTFGHSREAVIGLSMSQLLVAPASRQDFECTIQDYLRVNGGTRPGQRTEIQGLRQNAQAFAAELSVAPFKSGGALFLLASLHDISERKTLEAEQAHMTGLLKKTVNELAAQQLALDEHAIVSFSDIAGNITYVNTQFREISGYAHEELIGQNHRMLKSGMHDEGFYRDMWNTITSGQVWHGELANRNKDGSIYWTKATIVPILDAEGLPSHYISIRTDITHQKRTEQQLDAYQRHLESMIEKYRQSELELDRARAKELSIGHQIQRNLLFGNVPHQVGAFTISAYSEPSKGIDGDFYEFINHGDTLLDIAIGDVMGKGIPAALIGAAVKQHLSKALATHASGAALPEPERLINALHAAVSPRLIELESFVTLSYLRINEIEGALTLVDAGHTRTILASRQGVRLLSGDNVPLGVLEDELYVQKHVGFDPGDLLFLYSDGVTEARSPEGEECGLERLCQWVEELHQHQIPAPILIQAVRTRLREFEAHVPIADDRTCIAVQYNIQQEQLNPAHLFELPWQLNELWRLRNEIHAIAAETGMAESARDALTLAAFEAATNIIRHCTRHFPDSSIHGHILEVDDSISLSLHYLGEPFAFESAEAPDFSGESEGGFGLFIIRNSVDEVTYDSPAAGVNRIWMKKRKHPDV